MVIVYLLWNCTGIRYSIVYVILGKEYICGTLRTNNGYKKAPAHISQASLSLRIHSQLRGFRENLVQKYYSMHPK